MNKKNLLPPLQYITKKLVASSNRHSPAGNHMLSRSSFINRKTKKVKKLYKSEPKTWPLYLFPKKERHNCCYWLIPAPVRLIASRLRTFLMLRSSIITILCGGGWITEAPVTGVAPSWGLFVWTAKLDGSVIEAQIVRTGYRDVDRSVQPFMFSDRCPLWWEVWLAKIGGIQLKELRMWTRVLIQPYTERAIIPG